MHTFLRSAFAPLLLPLCAVAILSGCASPPPPVVVQAPPVKTCNTAQDTQVLGQARAEGEVTRVITTTRCITQ
ncbi:hypothetical protein QMK50_26125 [Pseudomonas sp. P5_152]|uniref:hypothetical protein n=1 Tax=Pseudomonas sp. P5_152 TaxID=3043442 RepID=UPI002A3605A0|nr:hypothetical protein [Pseudomonas sp. P5_152]MDX9668431.1 hypothetical protein [Pseudomonas sp. P5_152]